MKGHSHEQPLVGVIMGSDSDLPVMLPAARILDRFSVPYELTIVSAHRTPDRLVEYARSAAPRGLRVIVAGAGGAAHLPGMVASMTALPVIGVPVKGSSLDGVDSLHSIVQMPVSGRILNSLGLLMLTHAISSFSVGSRWRLSLSTTEQTRGCSLVRILAAGNPTLLRDMENYLKEQEKEVLVRVERLEQCGWEVVRYYVGSC
jgi:phosphoribosylaminoimidazole carboxylase